MTLASGVFGLTLRDQSDTSALGCDLLLDTVKIELVPDSFTPDFDVHDQEADITNEVTDSTNIPAGGIAASSQTWALASSVLTFDHANPAWTNATGSSIEGRVEYDDTVTGDPLLVCTDFGTPYSVTSGTLTIIEDASGIWYITYA